MVFAFFSEVENPRRGPGWGVLGVLAKFFRGGYFA
jgi:hypothetical protein